MTSKRLPQGPSGNAAAWKPSELSPSPPALTLRDTDRQPNPCGSETHRCVLAAHVNGPLPHTYLVPVPFSPAVLTIVTSVCLAPCSHQVLSSFPPFSPFWLFACASFYSSSLSSVFGVFFISMSHRTNFGNTGGLGNSGRNHRVGSFDEAPWGHSPSALSPRKPSRCPYHQPLAGIDCLALGSGHCPPTPCTLLFTHRCHAAVGQAMGPQLLGPLAMPTVPI